MNPTIYLALGLLLLSGCASRKEIRPQTQVEVQMIMPASAERIAMHEREVFLMPSRINNVLPSYPGVPKALERPLSIICIEIIVSVEGEVEFVSQIAPEPDCEQVDSNVARVFYPAVVEAAKQWDFIAAGICKFKKNELECDTSDAIVTPVSVKLAYKFEFSMIDGKRSVMSFGID